MQGSGNDFIKFLLLFFGILSAIGLVVAIIDLSEIGQVDDTKNLSGFEVGWKIADMLMYLIVFLFGSIFVGVVFAIIKKNS